MTNKFNDIEYENARRVFLDAHVRWLSERKASMAGQFEQRCEKMELEKEAVDAILSGKQASEKLGVSEEIAYALGVPPREFAMKELEVFHPSYYFAATGKPVTLSGLPQLLDMLKLVEEMEWGDDPHLLACLGLPCKNGEVDCTDLPVFSDRTPEGMLECIWSWDDEDVIEGDCIRDFQIRPRSDFFAEET